MSKTPNLDLLAAGAFDSFTARVDRAMGAVVARLQSVGGSAETSAAKLNSAIDPIEAVVKQVDDAANQLTNGGPPLAPYGQPPDVSAPSPAVRSAQVAAASPAPALADMVMIHGVPVPAAAAHADAERQAHARPAEMKGPA